MPATSKSQQRLFCMALAVRKGDLPRSKANDAVLKIADGKMTNKQIEDFTVLKENGMIHLKDYISESILRSVSAGKAFYTKAIADKNFTPELIDSLEKEVAIWKPKDKKELYDVTDLYIESAGPECSLNWIDVSGIKDVSNIFYKSNFNGDISKWNVSNVENMASMFKESKFNSDISKWDVSNVENKRFMFYDVE